MIHKFSKFTRSVSYLLLVAIALLGSDFITGGQKYARAQLPKWTEWLKWCLNSSPSLLTNVTADRHRICSEPRPAFAVVITIEAIQQIKTLYPNAIQQLEQEDPKAIEKLQYGDEKTLQKLQTLAPSSKLQLQLQPKEILRLQQQYPEAMQQLQQQDPQALYKLQQLDAKTVQKLQTLQNRVFNSTSYTLPNQSIEN